MEFMAQLEPSELEAISENPELLIAQISEAIEQIDNPDLKNELAKIVESEEFVEFVGNLAQAARQNNELNSAKNQQPQELVKPAETLKSAEAANPKRMPSHRENNSTNKNEEAVEEVEQNQPKTTETAKEETEHSEERSSKHLRSDRQKTIDSKAEPAKVSAESTEVTPKETLRQEFQKTVTREVPVNERAQNLENSEGQSPGNEKAEAILHKQINANTSANVLPEEVSKRFISLLTAKESNSQSKSFTYSNYGPVNQKETKANTSQNNANSGFGNGFSSNSGTSTAHATRQAPSANNNVFLSQLLEKAEMLKFSDGKKVLSLEMDPKELGKMEMELTSKDGTVTAKISAESELARIKLEELAPQIKEQLSNQGINLAEITVDISSQNPDERNNKQMSDRKNKSGRTEKVGANSDEQIIRKNILPNLRKVALNIQSVDLTV
jgi:flagellar hook-length control protein FliK